MKKIMLEQQTCKQNKDKTQDLFNSYNKLIQFINEIEKDIELNIKGDVSELVKDIEVKLDQSNELIQAIEKQLGREMTSQEILEGFND